MNDDNSHKWSAMESKCRNSLTVKEVKNEIDDLVSKGAISQEAADTVMSAMYGKLISNCQSWK